MKEFKDLPQETIDEFYDEAGKLLDGLWWCQRTWSAWGVGTMTQDDFVDASEDEGILSAVAEKLYHQRQKQPL